MFKSLEFRMFRRIGATAVALVVGCGSSSGVAPAEALGATARASLDKPSTHSAGTGDLAKVRHGARTTTSVRWAIEGDRYRVSTTIKSPKNATRVMVQKFDPPDYSFQDAEWVTVATAAVRGRSKVNVAVVATDLNTERYRSVVRYKKGKAVTSRPVAVTIWRWIPLEAYDPYYDTGGSTFGRFGINGRVYNGWGPWLSSHVGYWEARFTPGRHCSSFKAVIGLDDDSDDGSSGTVELTADDKRIYASHSLTPGTALPITLPLAKPYRLGIQLTDTTPGGTEAHDEVESYPAVGDPSLLCTGV